MIIREQIREFYRQGEVELLEGLKELCEIRLERFAYGTHTFDLSNIEELDKVSFKRLSGESYEVYLLDNEYIDYTSYLRMMHVSEVNKENWEFEMTDIQRLIKDLTMIKGMLNKLKGE